MAFQNHLLWYSKAFWLNSALQFLPKEMEAGLGLFLCCEVEPSLTGDAEMYFGGPFSSSHWTWLSMMCLLKQITVPVQNYSSFNRPGNTKKDFTGASFGQHNSSWLGNTTETWVPFFYLSSGFGGPGSHCMEYLHHAAPHSPHSPGIKNK